MLTAVHLHDERTGWAVGHDSAILRTGDGGETWRLLRYAPEMEPLLDVWFRDSETGFAVGAFGTFLATADGGATWTCRNGCPGDDGVTENPPLLGDGEFEDDLHLNRIAAAGPDRLYMAGEAGALYRSDDGGATWRALPSPYGGSWFGLLALDADTVLAAGLRGRLFRSEDGGESWTHVAAGTTATLTDAVRVAPDLILVTGLAGALFASRDGGRGVAPLPWPSRQGIAAALPAPGGAALLVGEFGIRPAPAVSGGTGGGGR